MKIVLPHFGMDLMHQERQLKALRYVQEGVEQERERYRNERDAEKAGMLWASQREEHCDDLFFADYCRFMLRRHDELLGVADADRYDTRDADDLVVRAAMSNAAISETFATNVGNQMAQAATDEPDTTAGWCYEGSARDFKAATMFTLESDVVLQKATKGRQAESTTFGTKGEPYSIARYAGQFTIDEQDVLNGATVGAIYLAARQHPVAAARLRPDLVYALLLANPTLTADNVALFHSSHSNKATGGSSALDATSLDTAISSIGLQHLNAAQDGTPIHGNLRARYLIVPPQLVGAARRKTRDMDTGDGENLIVRQESRLSAIGVVNPASGTIYSGSATNWLLTAPSASRPSIMVAGLNGPARPVIRRFDYTRDGLWGIGWDVSVDIGVAALDYRGMYFALGA